MMIRGTMIMGLFFAIFLIAAGFSSAQTLNFTATDTTGDSMYGEVDIVRMGAYVEGDYQYFYVETRDPGLATPDPGNTRTLEIHVEALVNGEDEPDYLDIYLTWHNDNGNISHLYTYSINADQSSGVIEDNSVTISGSKVTVRVLTLPLQDVEVIRVEFLVEQINPYGGDDYYYYLDSSGGSSENDNDGGSGGSSYNEPGPGMLGVMAGIGVFLCWGIWFIVWILVAIWVYKDAKKRNMDNPALWLIITLLLGLIGLIIYLVVRPKEPVQQTYQAPPPPPE